MNNQEILEQIHDFSKLHFDRFTDSKDFPQQNLLPSFEMELFPPFKNRSSSSIERKGLIFGNPLADSPPLGSQDSSGESQENPENVQKDPQRKLEDLLKRLHAQMQRRNRHDLESLRRFHKTDPILGIVNLPHAKFSELSERFKGVLPTEEMKAGFKYVIDQMIKKFPEKEIKELDLIFQEKLPPMILSFENGALQKEMELIQEIENLQNERTKVRIEIVEKKLQVPKREDQDNLELRKEEVRKEYEELREKGRNQFLKRERFRSEINAMRLFLDEGQRSYEFLKSTVQMQRKINALRLVFKKGTEKIKRLTEKTSYFLQNLLYELDRNIAEIKQLKAIVKSQEETFERLRKELKNQEESLYAEKTLLYDAQKVHFEKESQAKESESKAAQTKILVENQMENNISLYSQLGLPLPESTIRNPEDPEDPIASLKELEFLKQKEKNVLKEKKSLEERLSKRRAAYTEYTELLKKKEDFQAFLSKQELPVIVPQKSFSYIIYVYVALVCLFILRIIL